MFLKVANALLQLRLSPAALKVYVYLSYCSQGHKAIVKISTIQARCNIRSHTTVYKAISELIEHGLVQRERRKNYDGAIIANAYIVRELPGRWFKLARPVSAFCLDNRAFAVYLHYCQSARKGRAWPSLRRTAAMTRLCRNTVIRAVRLLQRLLGLIRQAWRPKTGNNVYAVTVLDIKNGTLPVSHNKQRTTSQDQINESCNFIVSILSRIVKAFQKPFSFLCQLFAATTAMHGLCGCSGSNANKRQLLGGSFFGEQPIDEAENMR